MAYRPPQRRQQPDAQDRNVLRASAPRNASRSNATGHAAPESSTYRPGPSRREWSAPSPTSGSLQSPAADIRPMRRTAQQVTVDEMDMMQSVSRSGGDGAEGDALKDHDTQERYREYIDSRVSFPSLQLDKHYARFGTARDVAPKAEETDQIESLSSIVLLLRKSCSLPTLAGSLMNQTLTWTGKLREGVVASSRIDDFAIKVFEQSVRIAILAKHQSQLISALSGLVPGLYLAVDHRRIKGKRRSVDGVTTKLAQLELDPASDRRQEFASIRLLYHLVQPSAPNSAAVFHETLLELTGPTPTRLCSAWASGPVYHQTSALLSRDQLSFAVQASRYLSPERFDPLGYFDLLRDRGDTRASTYERTVLGWAADKVRERSWEVMKRAYISTELVWAGRVCGLPDEEGEGSAEEWIRRQGLVVEGGKVKLR